MQNTLHQHNTLHPYAEILHATAEGKQIQVLNHKGEWVSISHAEVLNSIASLAYSKPTATFRIKPEVIWINGARVPKPCYKPLKLGTIYYPYLEGADGNKCSCVSWDNDNYDYRLLKLGLVHLTKEAASKHAEALLSFTQVNATVQQ